VGRCGCDSAVYESHILVDWDHVGYISWYYALLWQRVLVRGVLWPYVV
jgi:hypothetical protein